MRCVERTAKVMLLLIVKGRNLINFLFCIRYNVELDK